MQPLSLACKENYMKGKKILSCGEVIRKADIFRPLSKYLKNMVFGGATTGISVRKTTLFVTGRADSQLIQRQCSASCQHPATVTRSHTLRLFWRAYDNLFLTNCVEVEHAGRNKKRRRE